MKYIIIAALLIGCTKEPMTVAPLNGVDSIVFTANMGFGSVQVVHNGNVLDQNSDLRGSYRYAAPLTAGEYKFHWVSVAPGFTTVYIHTRDTLRVKSERSHSSRIQGTLIHNQ